MTITTNHLLKVLLVLSWIIFAGLSIEAAGLIVNTIATAILNPDGASRFWRQIDLSGLYWHDKGHFIVMNLLTIIIVLLECTIFYLIIRLLHGKKLDMSRPFSYEMTRFIASLAYLALMIGFFARYGQKYSSSLSSKGVRMPDIQDMHMAGPDVWLFMGIVLLVIAQIFKKGIEIQNENELTV
ncbi:DUF2975 domain-containing protein [Sediminibacterium ginsengisoli]|uniref:DUF2975 domain-containing protein n=1 Tax=Sediminibacterium ginsengisoli TaxID=413434 RepID=A0A1T4N7F6_9BACT|nr:DUF2975 domain-containing protein [Sediminibacterium ginsengisoli]SJZ75026.1 Protein of unknown function [Sediminibacterium ginsengisoli]